MAKGPDGTQRKDRLRRRDAQRVKPVIHAFAKGLDPIERLRNPRARESSWINPDVRVDYKLKDKIVPKKARSAPDAAGAALSRVLTSTRFASEVEARSKQAGKILENCLNCIDRMVTRYRDERDENMEPREKKPEISHATFVRVTEMLMRFYRETQRTVESSLQLEGSAAELGGLSDDELVALAMRLKGRGIEDERSIEVSGEVEELGPGDDGQQ